MQLKKTSSADELKCRDMLDFHEVKWIRGFSPQKGDACISAHNTANYFCTSGSFSAGEQSWNLKKRRGISQLDAKNTEGAWGNFFRALTKLNERRKWERHNCFQTMQPCDVYFSCGSKQGHVFPATDNEPPVALWKEKRRPHTWR